MTVLYTLVFVRTDSKVLLGYKKRGFGEGKWNGFGGKVNPGEPIVTAAIRSALDFKNKVLPSKRFSQISRELNEECSLVIEEENLSKIGFLTFEFVEDPGQIMEVHVFSSKIYQGEPKESEEMRPNWFDTEEFPFSEMWVDNKFWFPYLLAGKKFIGDFIVQGQDTVVSHKLKEVDELP